MHFDVHRTPEQEETAEPKPLERRLLMEGPQRPGLVHAILQLLQAQVRQPAIEKRS